MEHTADVPAYGLWGLVILNSVIFIGFAFSFFKPQSKTDWRSLMSASLSMRERMWRLKPPILS